MSENMIGVIVAVVFIAILGGVWLWSIWRQKQIEKTWPKTWVHKGIAPPDFVDNALQIIAKHTPGMPQAGYIEWIDGPFFIGTLKVAGTVDNTKPIYIRVMYFEKVEQSALTHELAHVWSDLTKQGFGESPQDKRLVKWFSDINAEIRVALEPLRAEKARGQV